MVKEVLITVGGLVVGATAAYVIYALVKYMKKQNELGITPEKAYFDEFNLHEVKRWFSENIKSEDEVGILFYPTEENQKKYNLNLELTNNTIIQVVYNQKNDEVIKYREVTFGEMSEKLNKLMEDNGGTIVIENSL